MLKNEVLGFERSKTQEPLLLATVTQGTGEITTQRQGGQARDRGTPMGKKWAVADVNDVRVGTTYTSPSLTVKLLLWTC